MWVSCPPLKSLRSLLRVTGLEEANQNTVFPYMERSVITGSYWGSWVTTNYNHGRNTRPGHDMRRPVLVRRLNRASSRNHSDHLPRIQYFHQPPAHCRNDVGTQAGSIMWVSSPSLKNLRSLLRVSRLEGANVNTMFSYMERSVITGSYWGSWVTTNFNHGRNTRPGHDMRRPVLVQGLDCVSSRYHNDHPRTRGQSTYRGYSTTTSLHPTVDTTWGHQPYQFCGYPPPLLIAFVPCYE